MDARDTIYGIRAPVLPGSNMSCEPLYSSLQLYNADHCNTHYIFNTVDGNLINLPGDGS